jgi:hypothetical protein
VNPSPAFSYYEAHTGRPIAQAIARYLAAEARVRACGTRLVFGELMAPGYDSHHSQRIAFCADRAVMSIIGNGDGTF